MSKPDIPSREAIESVIASVKNSEERLAAQTITMACLTLARDVWYPQNPEGLADWFWQDGDEIGYGSVAETLRYAAEDYHPGDVALVSVERIMRLPAVHAVFVVDGDGKPSDPTFHNHFCAASSKAAQMEAEMSMEAAFEGPTPPGKLP
ncbi:MAG: hypothetical protein AAGE03_04465 [Pseudomonadota bacterium]